MNLNLDCQLLIVEQLPLTALITMAETNKYFLQLARDVFERKFSKTRVEFQAPFMNSPKVYSQTVGPVKIKDLETVSKVLKYFGRSIESLKVRYYTSDNKTHANINQLINSQCADTLKQFNVVSYKNRFFDDFSAPFKKVENVSVRGVFNRFGGDDFCFDALFPSMHRLSLELAEGLNMSWFHREFKHLEHVNIDLCAYDAPGCFSEQVLEKFFEKNAQIRSLKISYFTRNLLKHAARDLEKLENLQIEMHEDQPEDDSTENGHHIILADDSEIYFEHLKSLSMKRSSNSLPKNITLRNLIELQTDAYPRKCLRWIEFVESSASLRKLTLNGRHLRKEEVSRLAAANLHLTEARIKCKSDVDYETIAKFIENSKFLKRLSIKFSRTSIPHVTFHTILELLKQNFGDKWTINGTDSREIILECISDFL